MNRIVLDIQNLKKYYGKTVGVEDVSLKIEEGKIYGFIGPNGAGKSTTIRTTLGLINKDCGKIYFSGKEFDKDDLDMKNEIGYLPSEINLYEDFTIKQMFDYHETFYKKDLKQRRSELVSLLQIDEEKKISDLSLGNLKKVGIVLALMHEPKLLILDEPTSGLDPIMQKTFHDILVEEKKKNTTILYSSHVLSELSNICDIVGFIKNGKIIKEDTIENIKKDYFTYLTIKSKDIERIKEELDLQFVREEDGKVTFINKLKPNEVTKCLAKYDIETLLIEEVSLEDLFINYYM